MKTGKIFLLLIAVLCALCLAFGATGCTDAGNAGFTKERSLRFVEIKENGKIVGYSVSQGTATDADIVIPSTYNNLPVTVISDTAFFEFGNLKSITIPESVTAIGDNAFKFCDNLTSVTITQSITSIGENAFSGCKSLVSVTFENADGWSLFKIGATGETGVNVSDPVKNATYLTDTYRNFCWKRG